MAAALYHGLALVNDGSPQMLQPPVGLTAYTGRDVKLSAFVVGAAPLTYQWLVNGTNVPGATNSSLLLANIQLANAGNYQLWVSNSVGTALSLIAPVKVIGNSSLVFLSQTSVSATNVYQGGQVNFYGGTVQGSGPLTYQWYFSPTNRNYTPVIGATNDTLVLEPALAGQSGNYYLAVSNPVAGLTSPPVTIRVQFAKAWGYQPVDPPFVLSNATAVALGNYGSGSMQGAYLALSSAGKISSWSSSYLPYGETNCSPTVIEFHLTETADSAPPPLHLGGAGTASVVASIDVRALPRR